MIVDTFTEKEILDELYTDYTKNVKPTLKKQAKKHLAPYMRRGQIIREPEFYQVCFTTKMNNRWTAYMRYGGLKNAQWLSTSCCIVENVEKRTKDYYILRGLSDSPYFIKLSAHTVKRLKERNDYHSLAMDFVPCQVFMPHETVIMLNYFTQEQIDDLSLLDDIDDFSEFTKIVISYKGVFFAKRLACGNFVFKTYINHEMAFSGTGKSVDDGSMIYDRQGIHTFTGYMIHQYFNKYLYSEKQLDELLYKYDGNKEIRLDADPDKVTLLKP